MKINKNNKQSTIKLNGLFVEIQTKYNDSKQKHQRDLEVALQELKKMVKKEELMQELRDRQFFLSPSKARRYKKNEALKQRKRDEKKKERQEKKENTLE